MKRTILKFIAAGAVAAVAVVSCQKENDFKEDFNGVGANSMFVLYDDNELQQKLDVFWNAYTSFKGLSFGKNGSSGEGGEVSIIPIDVSPDEAFTLLHYALNIGFVDPRITYTDIDSINIVSSLPVNGPNVLYNDLLQVFDYVRTHVQIFKQNFANGENKTLNRLEIEVGLPNGNEIAFTVKVVGTSGEVWAHEELDNAANTDIPIGVYPSTPIPWITQKSWEGGFESSSNPNNIWSPLDSRLDGAPTSQNLWTPVWYARWLFTGAQDKTIGTNGATLAQMRAEFGKLPNVNIKAAHHYLTHHYIYWPSPADQANGWNPAYDGKIPVRTPPTSYIPNTNNLTATFSGKYDNWLGNHSDNGVLMAPEVLACDNPNYQVGGDGSLFDGQMRPSRLLAYYKTEKERNLTAVRTVDNNTMNYFWSKRAAIAIASANDDELGVLFNPRKNAIQSGFYVLTAYRTKVLADATVFGFCSSVSSDPNCYVPMECTVGPEYYFEPEYSHYRLLPPPPAGLGSIF